MFQALEQRLEAAGNSNPKRSMEELAAYVLGCKPLEIYFREITAEQREELDSLIARAACGEPIQYIIGHVDFRGLEIFCDPRALIPRPETELLVEEVLSKLETRNLKREVVDVCTGTGCVGLALAHELPNANVTAIDISPEALSLANENAVRLGLADRFQCVENNLLEDAEEASLDVVVSNPPYIFSTVWETLEPCVRDHEPQLALDGGEQGMDLIVPLIEQAARVLKPGGGLFLEIGYDQGQETCGTLTKAGFENVRIIKDYSGHDRVVGGSLPG